MHENTGSHEHQFHSIFRVVETPPEEGRGLIGLLILVLLLLFELIKGRFIKIGIEVAIYISFVPSSFDVVQSFLRNGGVN